MIDPCFREQFEIANPTAQYSTVLAEVPREFVGTEEGVTQLVELLSAELKKSFQVGHQLSPLMTSFVVGRESPTRRIRQRQPWECWL